MADDRSMIKKLAPTFIALLALAPAAQAASTGTDGRIVYQVDQSAQSIKPSGKDRVRIANGNIAEPARRRTAATSSTRETLTTRPESTTSGRCAPTAATASG